MSEYDEYLRPRTRFDSTRLDLFLLAENGKDHRIPETPTVEYQLLLFLFLLFLLLLLSLL